MFVLADDKTQLVGFTAVELPGQRRPLADMENWLATQLGRDRAGKIMPVRDMSKPGTGGKQFLVFKSGHQRKLPEARTMAFGERYFPGRTLIKANGPVRNAPLLLLDRTTKVPRLLQLMSRLCELGAVLAIGAPGYPSVARHHVALGTYEAHENCGESGGYRGDYGKVGGGVAMRVTPAGLSLTVTGTEHDLGAYTDAKATGAAVAKLLPATGKLRVFVSVQADMQVHNMVTLLDALWHARIGHVHLGANHARAKRGAVAAGKVRVKRPITLGELPKELRGAKGVVAVRPETLGETHLSTAGILRRVNKQRDQIQSCKRHHPSPSRVSGVVKATLVVAKDGSVRVTKATGVHPKVARCVSATLRRMRFPKLTNGPVTIKLPLLFAPGR